MKYEINLLEVIKYLFSKQSIMFRKSPKFVYKNNKIYLKIS